MRRIGLEGISCLKNGSGSPSVKGMDSNLAKLLGTNSLHTNFDYLPYLNYGNISYPTDPTSYFDRLTRGLMYPGKLLKENNNQNLKKNDK